MPRERTLVKFGKDTQAFELTGRIHLDYLELYRKFTYHEMHSYSLDAIGEYELQERKVAYEGTLMNYTMTLKDYITGKTDLFTVG